MQSRNYETLKTAAVREQQAAELAFQSIPQGVGSCRPLMIVEYQVWAAFRYREARKAYERLMEATNG